MAHLDVDFRSELLDMDTSMTVVFSEGREMPDMQMVEVF